MDHYFINNENLKSEIKKITYQYQGQDLIFYSDNGVFSKSHIDYGSRLLVDTFLKNYHQQSSILDVGCGYGFIGITIAKILNKKVDMLDINRRAIHLAKMNIEANKVAATIYESNCYELVHDQYDVIITNPPVRAGKKVILQILTEAKDHLNDQGELWYVLRKDQGAKSISKVLNEHYAITIVEKSKGFYIFCCKKR